MMTDAFGGGGRSRLSHGNGLLGRERSPFDQVLQAPRLEIHRLSMVITWLLIAGVSLVLSGCTDTSKKFPPARDYCETFSRTLSPEEKKVTILTRMYFAGKHPKYIADFVESDAGPEPNEQQVRSAISKYLAKDPLCCQLLRQDHLGNRIFNDDYFLDDMYSRFFRWGYMADFFVFTQAEPASNHYRLSDAFSSDDLAHGGVLMVNNCGETKSFSRG